MTLRLLAPAKLNWTLEVLGKRPDGYHEIRSILQTIDLADVITLRAADDITLSVTGNAGHLATEPLERNLAYRAATALRGASTGGVHIELAKTVPVAAGLGGGSSDAAAVLRGLRRLWSLAISDADLQSVAAQLGSDVPFFLCGGTALALGRGDVIDPLPGARDQQVIIASKKGAIEANKTAAMFGALRPEYYTDGSRTEQLAARCREGVPLCDDDLFNVFESVLPVVDPEASRAFDLASRLRLGTPHLCGSGPALFFLVPPQVDTEIALLGLPHATGLTGVLSRTIDSAAATLIEEVA